MSESTPTPVQARRPVSLVRLSPRRDMSPPQLQPPRFAYHQQGATPRVCPSRTPRPAEQHRLPYAAFAYGVGQPPPSVAHPLSAVRHSYGANSTPQLSRSSSHESFSNCHSDRPGDVSLSTSAGDSSSVGRSTTAVSDTEKVTLPTQVIVRSQTAGSLASLDRCIRPGSPPGAFEVYVRPGSPPPSLEHGPPPSLIDNRVDNRFRSPRLQQRGEPPQSPPRSPITSFAPSVSSAVGHLDATFGKLSYAASNVTKSPFRDRDHSPASTRTVLQRSPGLQSREDTLRCSDVHELGAHCASQFEVIIEIINDLDKRHRSLDDRIQKRVSHEVAAQVEQWEKSCGFKDSVAKMERLEGIDILNKRQLQGYGAKIDQLQERIESSMEEVRQLCEKNTKVIGGLVSKPSNEVKEMRAWVEKELSDCWKGLKDCSDCWASGRDDRECGSGDLAPVMKELKDEVAAMFQDYMSSRARVDQAAAEDVRCLRVDTVNALDECGRCSQEIVANSNQVRHVAHNLDLAVGLALDGLLHDLRGWRNVCPSIERGDSTDRLTSKRLKGRAAHVAKLLDAAEQSQLQVSKHVFRWILEAVDDVSWKSTGQPGEGENNWSLLSDEPGDAAESAPIAASQIAKVIRTAVSCMASPTECQSVEPQVESLSVEIPLECHSVEPVVPNYSN